MQTDLRKQILARLPFKPEIIICRGKEITDLVAALPFGSEPAAGVKQYVTILARRPRSLPDLPIAHPSARAWEVKLLEVRGRFVLSLHRPTGRPTAYPNEIVEQLRGIPATTRTWGTILKINDVLSN